MLLKGRTRSKEGEFKNFTGPNWGENYNMTAQGGGGGLLHHPKRSKYKKKVKGGDISVAWFK